MLRYMAIAILTVATTSYAVEPFGPDWLIVENQPCQVHNPSPLSGESVTWSGGCVDGKASGEGRLFWHSSTGEDVYEGEFRDGKIHGRGNFFYANGNRYEGEWHDGKKHGRGTYTWTEGDRYEGPVVRAVCFGIAVQVRMFFDEGEFRDGKIHGRGNFFYANGNRYEGEWHDGKKLRHARSGNLYLDRRRPLRR